MAGTNEKILDTISNMTVMEVVDLISHFQIILSRIFLNSILRNFRKDKEHFRGSQVLYKDS